MLSKSLMLLPCFFLLVSCAGLKPKTSLQDPRSLVSDSEELTDEQQLATESASQESLGVILGPGYLKTYGHIGVLKELDRRAIPVAAIAGVGWGAVIAGAYSINGRSSDLEWQLFKMPEELLAEKALFSGKISPGNTKNLEGFFSKLFRSGNLGTEKPAFACPSFSLKSLQGTLVERGVFSRQVPACLAGNSFFDKAGDQVWDPLAIEALVDFLRKKGATKILLVDVLNPQDYARSRMEFFSELDYYIWAKQDQALKAMSKKVDYYLSIPLGAYRMNDYSALRNFVREGEVRSERVLDQVSKDIIGR